MKNILLSLLFVFTLVEALSAQTTKKVLFIGNSYTAVNDLPAIVSNMAINTGDVLTFDTNNPGGYRFLNHAADATTLNKINSNTWDYVVLQAQSQETAFSETQKTNEVYPYATALSNAIRANNECSQPLFYMTWGRDSGDSGLCPFLPWTCTYEGMDDAIKASYLFMAEENDAEVAPAGAVWRYLRTNFPNINLYASDGSHPSPAGSYAAACALYTIIFKKDPTLIIYNYSISESNAAIIRAAAKTIVFDELATFDFTLNTSFADFTEQIQQATVSFTNTSEGYDMLTWDFGDGSFSAEENPVHTYAANGSYIVSLTTTKCGKSYTTLKTLEIDADLSFNAANFNNEVRIFPNPTTAYFTVNLKQVFTNALVLLYDSRGTPVFTKEFLDSSSFMLNIAHLSAGLYTVKIATNQQVYFSKIIKR